MCLFAMHGCQKDIEAPVNDIIITDQVEASHKEATISGTVECPVSITKIELWMDSDENFSNHNVHDIELSDKAFSILVNELNFNTTYYYKYVVYNAVDMAELEKKNFTTASSINGHNWVDLGLPSGLKWATCNVGATFPEDYGNYYAWGETTTKESYDESNCTTWEQEISDISGNATYDAARVNWGSTWRMPTEAEMQELVNNCTWTWTTESGVNGMRVTGPNGNTIFFPAAGGCVGSSRCDVGEVGYYWSSTPSESSTHDVFSLLFGSGVHYVGELSRCPGVTVRPVSD